MSASTPRSREESIGRMRDWLLRVNPAVVASNLDENTDIIETRVLESLQLVEFMLFLEQETGRGILAEGLDPSTLRTLAVVYSNYFGPPKE